MVMVMGVALGPLVMVMGGRLTSPTGHGHGGEVDLPLWSWSWGEFNLPPLVMVMGGG